MMLARRPWQAGLAAVLLLGAAGCAFDPGEPYGRVAARLESHLATFDDRDAGQGFQQLASDFQLHLTSAQLWVDALELRDAGADATVASFDPANPPAGYSLCHSGHCHADDGSLVAYEDIAAELAASGGSEPRTVVSMAPAVIDLLDPNAVTLSCQPSCALPEGYLVLSRLTASRLVATGEVRDHRAEPRLDGVHPLALDLSLLEPPPHEDETATPAPAGSFELRLDLPVGEDHPVNIDLGFALPMTIKLFDGVDFAAVLPHDDGVLDLGDPSAAEARDELRAEIAALHLAVAVTRSEP